MIVISKNGSEYEWDYALDLGEENSLVVMLFDKTGEIDLLGGIEVPFEVSDHGNINVSPETEEYLRQTAQDMADNLD